MSDYLTILILSFIIPFLASFWPPLRFYRNSKSLIISIFLIALMFGAWDILATARGHWTFNPNGVGRLRIFNLPLEEVLFFIVIPFCCIFTWEAINYIKKRFR